MALFIHHKNKFDKNLATLCRTGKKASLAAKQARNIIERLAANESTMQDTINKQTKRGELRIQKCRKYDLGAGYRMVCLKSGGAPCRHSYRHP